MLLQYYAGQCKHACKCKPILWVRYDPQQSLHRLLISFSCLLTTEVELALNISSIHTSTIACPLHHISPLRDKEPITLEYNTLTLPSMVLRHAVQAVLISTFLLAQKDWEDQTVSKRVLSLSLSLSRDHSLCPRGAPRPPSCLVPLQFHKLVLFFLPSRNSFFITTPVYLLSAWW